jgi:hypothetical protein
MFITEDRGLVRVMVTAGAECPSRVSINVPAICRTFKKDVNFNGTNLRTPLESTKASKNKPKKGPRIPQKRAPNA